MLKLSQYRQLINLDENFSLTPVGFTEKEECALVNSLLTKTAGIEASGYFPKSFLYPRDRLYARLISRIPFSLCEEVLKEIDRLFVHEKSKMKIMKSSEIQKVFKHHDFSTKVALWQGDICSLAVDAIVNAANERMLGCFHPFHRCIDNVIHAASGPRLRDDCSRIVNLQGEFETIGCAKITRAYHLPSQFILHTVGPIYENPSRHSSYSNLLSECYKSCLNLADQLSAISSIAFPCISTGLFGFPNEAAAQIALNSVMDWLQEHPQRFSLIVFNVFLDKDFKIYQNEIDRRNNNVSKWPKPAN
ncbi:MAG: protein-ADP-ribose hydrolase [Candidatus Riflebacteria bacterium]|nr:protein-ADP-ribose hydrolase [Candidatus Riflebacteria bacterium]